MATETSGEPFGYEVAEAIAQTWAARRAEVEEIATPIRAWMLRELGARAGETVLEIAAGVGETGFEAAAAVGEGGRLITTDLSPAMLEAARRRGAELGVRNVEYRAMDAERLDLGDDAVDRALCRFGFMLMPDPARALAEARRVLRPGGRLALAVWGPLERNPFFTAVGMPLVERGHMPMPEPPPAPGIFSMGDPARVTALLREAGFEDVRVEEVPVRFLAADVDHYLAFIADTAGPLALVLQGLSEADRAEVRRDVAAALDAFATDEGHALPGLAICASAG